MKYAVEFTCGDGSTVRLAREFETAGEAVDAQREFVRGDFETEVVARVESGDECPFCDGSGRAPTPDGGDIFCCSCDGLGQFVERTSQRFNGVNENAPF